MQKMYKFLFTMLATLCFAICCSGCSENYNNQNTIKIKNKSLDRFLMYQYKLDVPDTDELDIDKFIELDLYIDKSTDCEYLVSSNSEMVQLVTAEGTPYAEKYKENKNRFFIMDSSIFMNSIDSSIIVDNNTGVQYLVKYKNFSNILTSTKIGSITILTDKDGKPYIGK